MQRLTIYAAVVATLTGCSGHYAPSAEKTAVDQLKTINDNSELCLELAKVNSIPAKSGGVATMQREDFDIYYAQKTYLKQRIAARRLDCSKLNNSQKATLVGELSPEQALARVSTTCNAIAQRSQFADRSSKSLMTVFDQFEFFVSLLSRQFIHDIKTFDHVVFK